MTAYLISEVEILGPAAGQRYRELADASLGRYGGRYLVRGAVFTSRKATGRRDCVWSSSSSPRTWD